MKPAGRNRRTVLTGALFLPAAAATALVVAGCTSGGASSSSSAAAPPASTAAAPSSPAISAAPSSPAASAAPAASNSPNNVTAGNGTPACATRGLQATVGISQGAAGSIYQVIDFKNISGTPCTLFGYPGVALAGGAPVTQIGAAATRNSAASATTVTLGAGDTANALLRISQAADYTPSDCHPTATSFLQIYPPNQTTPIYLAYKSTACAKTSVPPQLSIGVVQAGNGG